MNRVRQLLRWLRIEDVDGVLSLTTVAFVVGCYCLVAGKQVSLPELAAFSISVASYHGTKLQRSRKIHADLAARLDGVVEIAKASAEKVNDLEMRKTMTRT